MTTINAVLVDDEADSLDVLSRLIENHFPQIAIVGKAFNVDKAYELIKSAKPQLVFLDIQMPRYSGFELLKKYTEVPFEVIFVTSYDKYAINAIRFSALDYLLKPVEIAELQNSVERAVHIIQTKRHTTAQVINLLHSLDENNSQKKIAVHSGGSVKLLASSNVVYIEGAGRYTKIHMSNGEVFSTAKYIKEFEDYFGENSMFLRIHHGSLINISLIKEYTKKDPCIITMTNGKTFEISRRKKTEVLDILKNR